MATFNERKARTKKDNEVKPYVPFTLPTFKVDSLEEADALIDFFQTFGNKDGVKFIETKTAKFRE